MKPSVLRFHLTCGSSGVLIDPDGYDSAVLVLRGLYGVRLVSFGLTD